MKGNTLTDAVGIQHSPVTESARIVSLVPSITELLFALGLGEQVVGRSHYCVHPALAVAALPSVGGTKKIRHSRLRALRPSHVILNIDENPKLLADQLADYVPQIIVTHPLTPEDNVPLYRLIGSIFNRGAEAETLAATFEQALAELRQVAWLRRRVLYLIWRKPWMGVSRDTYIARMLALVEWETLPAESEARYPVLELNRALLDAADLVLFSSEPYRFQPADLNAFARTYDCPLEKLRLIDGEMTSWYGNRAIAGLAYLARFASENSQRSGAICSI
ncbi:MAG: ABC transporter substrate-binding protein [Candidatus Competibacteraceae bacterium]|uniref:Periplasmic metal binding protein n=1 Tax=Candidatus Contendobacter odensis Run_B_J11 TaxID=1400861 RepID=A0A7U7G912_9GAMM|nr:helical backbone metal receptor [Candidatus Contendobacter odensis]MBK8535913.1 ABC transporter substrate-binding protein [Candidatus Competibacteraceae bacterium]MBK8750377.1 ABC transporter substrate-binding protein [Candidatus Competibacteraceae bacterium]CDH43711.1 putative periplasmic metal binding protein [Candidatus Contendobacter odensis Run_B_J11]